MTGVGDLARLEAVSARTGAPTPELRLAYAAGGQESMLRQSVSALRASALPTERARWRTRLGRLRRGLRRPEQGLEERTVWLSFVAVVPDLVPRRGDPGYDALLGRMRLR